MPAEHRQVLVAEGPIRCSCGEVWPCERAGINGPDSSGSTHDGAMTEPWQASDGTMWLYSPEFNIWNGWMPGEDGLWEHAPDEFHRLYPDAPQEPTP